MKKTERIGGLVLYYLLRALSPAQERELADWRNASELNERLFREETAPERILEEIRRREESRQRIWEGIKDQLPAGEAAVRSNVRILVKRVATAAAILILLACLGLYFLKHGDDRIRPGSYKLAMISANGSLKMFDDFNRGFLAGRAGVIIKDKGNGVLWGLVSNDMAASKDRYYRLYTPRGGQMILQFPDSSMIWLNAATTIKYPANFFRDTIDVQIEGEAYFELAKKPGFVYRINGKELEIKARNASFNIKTDSEDGLLTATLVSGDAIAAEDSLRVDSGMPIRAGEQLLMHAGRMTINPAADTADILAWKNNKTSFHHASIQTIMSAVARWYDADIIYQGKLPDKKYSVLVPRNADITELLKELEKQGLHFSIHKKTITVMP